MIGALCELSINVLGFCLKLRFKDIVGKRVIVVMGYIYPNQYEFYFYGGKDSIPRSMLIAPAGHYVNYQNKKKRGVISL